MAKTNSKVDTYLSKTKNWQEETKKLRKILLDCGLTEELKWKQPCYTFQESNIVLIQGFKEYIALLFFKGALLKDPKDILTKMGENTRIGRQMRFTNLQEITKLAPAIKAYIKEAIKIEKAGLKVELKEEKLVLPAELKKKFKEDPKLKAAWEALTPGRQRGYNIHFSGAKQSQTRESRIEKCIPKILKGKGFNDR